MNYSSIQVDAYPPVVNYNWYFNNSDHNEALEHERFSSDGLVSSLEFSPTGIQDYGALYCSGENIIGRQGEPCVFKIVPTGEMR
jgi:hypothetical protein